jgi:DNA-binding XRE family transcriptional regulator
MSSGFCCSEEGHGTATRVDRLRAKPEVASDVAKRREARAEMNRAYAMNLAMIRKAADFTQDELAERLGVDQRSVSRLENRQDMLLSTRASYPCATEVGGDCIVVTVLGEEYALDLGSFGIPQAEAV